MNDNMQAHSGSCTQPCFPDRICCPRSSVRTVRWTLWRADWLRVVTERLCWPRSVLANITTLQRGEGVGCSRDREVIDAGNRANQYSTRAIHRRVYSPVYNCMYLRLNSVECTVTTYRLGGLGFECRQGQNMLFFLQNRPDWLWGPTNILFNGYRVCLSEVKQPEREVCHLPLSNALGSKNVWSCT